MHCGKSGLYILIVFLIFSGTILGQPCTENNNAFRSGEVIKYNVHYNFGFVWLDAGEATFTVESEQYKGKPTYHLKGEGHTFENYDHIYKVRDVFESWIDTSSLKPYRSIRNSNEGGNRIYNDHVFDYTRRRVLSFVKYDQEEMVNDTIDMKPCVNDVLTMIYSARNIDFSSARMNDTIPIRIVLDHEIHEAYIRFLGRDNVQTALGMKKVIKFSPLLIEGTIFKGGEGMIVYVTDDDKKVPLYIETPIVVGSIKVKIKSYKAQ